MVQVLQSTSVNPVLLFHRLWCLFNGQHGLTSHPPCFFSRSIDSMGRTKGITGDKPNNHLVLLKPVCLYLYICLAIATHCGSKLQMRFPKDTQLPLRLARLPWLAPLTRLVLLTLLATEGVAGRTSSVFWQFGSFLSKLSFFLPTLGWHSFQQSHGFMVFFTPRRWFHGVLFHFHTY